MMKKIIPLLILLSGILKSQNASNPASVGNFAHTQYLKWNYPWLENFVAGKKLKDLKFTELVKNNEGDAFYFNEKGFTQKAVYQHYYDNNFRTSTSDIHEYSYDKADNLLEVKHFNKEHKLVYGQSWTYYTPKKFSSITKSRKGKPVSETVYSYNPDSALVCNESFYYKDDTKKSRSRYLYSYGEDKKLNKVMFYRKDKLSHTWNYSCDERGKLVKHDTTTICTSEGFDNKGRKVVTKFSSEAKGMSTKAIYYYWKNNGQETLSESKYYRVKKGKEILLYECHEPDSLESFYRFNFYNKHGRLIHQELTNYFTYSTKLKQIKDKSSSFFNKNGIAIFTRVESFTERGLPSSSIVTGVNNKNIGKVEYVFVNDKEFLINHYQKSRLKRVYKAELSYY